MAVARKRTKMRRTQISLPPEQFERARQYAELHGISLSEAYRMGFECLAERDEAEHTKHMELMMSIVGIAESDDSHGSERVDEVVYGRDPHR